MMLETKLITIPLKTDFTLKASSFFNTKGSMELCTEKKENITKGLLRPPFAWAGSKWREISFIAPYFPGDCSTLVESCAGMGAVSIYCLQARPEFKKILVNDTNKALVKFYKTMKKKDSVKNLITELRSMPMKEATLKSNKYSSVAMLYFRSRATLLSKGTTVKRYKTESGEWKAEEVFKRLEKLYKYIPLYNKLTATSVDIIEVFKRYHDDENVFIYCDPPYLTTKVDEYYNGQLFTTDKLDYIVSALKTAKCKIMLNLDFNGYTFLKYHEFIKAIYPVSYSNNTTALYQKYHMVITNYIKEKGAQ